MKITTNKLRMITAILSAAALTASIGCSGEGKLNLPGPQHYTTVTADGWALSVLRYRPKQINKEKYPVILCHGLSYNSQFWDLDKDVSLARFLCNAGYDVWVPSLRGAGWSTKPPISRLRQLFLRGNLYTTGGVFTSAGKGLLKINWTVDDHIKYDVPAIISFVCKETKSKKVHWIGHSLGGMILIGYLHTTPQEKRIASFVALAVPVFAIHPLSKALEQLTQGRVAIELSNAMISTNLPALIGMIAGKALPTPIDMLFYNPANVDYDIIHRLNAWGTEDISPGQLGQLIDMLKKGKFTSIDGKIDYTAGLGQMRIPAMFCVGTLDNLATVCAVKRLYNQWGAKKKRFLLFGKVNGYICDYGHDDIIIGRYARREVFPAILQWLNALRAERTGAIPWLTKN